MRTAQNETLLWLAGMNCVKMLIASAKSRSTRGASHQPAFMGGCLTISKTCLPCPPSGRVSPCVPGVIEGNEDAWGAIMWGVGEMLVYGICNRRLVLQESG